jgi:CBS domain-containing protein
MRHDPIDPAAAGRPPLCAAFVMSRPPVTIGERASIVEAITLMVSHRIHYLPVLREDGALVGIVNADDLRRTPTRATDDVAAVMSSPVVSIDGHASIAEAVRLMSAHGVGALPVVEGGRVVGILTQSDIVARVTGKLA